MRRSLRHCRTIMRIAGKDWRSGLILTGPSSYLPSPGGGGSARMERSEMRTGVGRRSVNSGAARKQRLSPHPAALPDDASRRRVASTLPLQGRVKKKRGLVQDRMPATPLIAFAHVGKSFDGGRVKAVD